MERARFSRNWTSSKSWFSGLSEYSRARRQVREELRMGQHIEHVLHDLGYRLAEDAWDSDGRRTYLSDDDADRQFLKDLQATLSQYGWVGDKRRLRCFRCAATREFIEVESGGADTSGHFLHLLKVGMTRMIDDGLADVQIQDYSKLWITVSRVVNNLQRIGYELRAIQSRYPDRRVRAVDNNGRLIDLL
jgi:hypothetical protein